MKRVLKRQLKVCILRTYIQSCILFIVKVQEKYFLKLVFISCDLNNFHLWERASMANLYSLLRILVRMPKYYSSLLILLCLHPHDAKSILLLYSNKFSDICNTVITSFPIKYFIDVAFRSDNNIFIASTEKSPGSLDL